MTRKKQTKKYKLKTKKSAAKRFSVTSSGKLKRRSPGLRHILEKQSAKRKRNKQNDSNVSPADEKRVKRMLSL